MNLLDYLIVGVRIVDAAGYAAAWAPVLASPFAFLVRKVERHGVPESAIARNERQQNRDQFWRFWQLGASVIAVAAYVVLKMNGALSGDEALLRALTPLLGWSAFVYWAAVLSVIGFEVRARYPVPD